MKEHKKDIVFLCQFFYPEYVTSAKLPFQTAKHLGEEGYSISALCGYPKEYTSGGGKIPKTETMKDIFIKRIKYLQLGRASKLSRLINYFSFVLMMFLQIPFIGKHKIVIVYSNPPILPLIALIANKIYKTKIVFVSYDVYPEIATETDAISEDSVISKFMTWLNNKLFKSVDLVVALSSDMKKRLLELRDISADKVAVIENWATEEGQSNKVYSNNKSKDKPIVISYLGNMGIPQDFDTILKAIKDDRLKNNPDVEFKFAGHGNQKEKIRKFAADNKIDNLTVDDYLAGKEYEERIMNTDAFILSLKEKLTGLAVPSKFYTYLLMNKYIISVIDDSTDISKQIKELKIGISVNNGDTDKLVQQILELTKDKSLLSIPKNIYSKYYSKDIQLDKYSNEIKNII